MVATELGVAVLVNLPPFVGLPFAFVLSVVSLGLPALLGLMMMRPRPRMAVPGSWGRGLTVAVGCIVVLVGFVLLIGPDYIVDYTPGEILRLGVLVSVETFVAQGVLFGGLLLALSPLSGGRRLLAYLVVILFFGLWHVPVDGASALVASVPFSVASCLVYDFSGNLLAPIALHLVNDTGAVVLPQMAITGQGLVVTPAIFQVSLLVASMAIALISGWKRWNVASLSWRGLPFP